MAPLARTPSLKRLAAEPKDRATPPTPTAQPSDWGHYDTGEKPPDDQNEDNEANDNDDTISWAGAVDPCRAPRAAGPELAAVKPKILSNNMAVSYTHLTLPTKA